MKIIEEKKSSRACFGASRLDAASGLEAVQPDRLRIPPLGKTQFLSFLAKDKSALLAIKEDSLQRQTQTYLKLDCQVLQN